MTAEEKFRDSVKWGDAEDGIFTGEGNGEQGLCSADELIWVAANYDYAKEIINDQLPEDLEVAIIEYIKPFKGNYQDFIFSANLRAKKDEWTDADYTKEEEAKDNLQSLAKEVEYHENSRLYNEFAELAEDGELAEDKEHFTIEGITDEIKAWIEKDDYYDARQILDNAVPTKDGFLVIGWQWSEGWMEDDDTKIWVLTAELEY